MMEYSKPAYTAKEWADRTAEYQSLRDGSSDERLKKICDEEIMKEIPHVFCSKQEADDYYNSLG